MIDITNPIFADAEKAREHLESINWPDGPVCPHCGEEKNVHRLQGKSTRAGLVQCNACLKNFTVTVGTVFERSKIPLNKWLLATYLLSSSKKGMSAHQLHRMLGITYKTAWFMAHRIREAMKPPVGADPMGGPGEVVEADETYVGGKESNKHAHKRSGLTGFAGKKAVVTLIERGGRARSFHVGNATAKTLRSILVTNVHRTSWLMTDDNSAYQRVGREFASHSSVSHSLGEYGRGQGFVHSNTAENFFSIFKRGVIGTYHHLSENHLHRYTVEFDFRYNTRKMLDSERATLALMNIVGKRLTYRRPASLAA
jgi:transposase-like protein